MEEQAERPGAGSAERSLYYERALREICAKLQVEVQFEADYDPANMALHLVDQLRMPKPLPMRIHCPAYVHGRMCGVLHVDVEEWATKPHKSHTCQACGHTWQPALFHTVGVRFLPGTQSEPAEEAHSDSG